MIVEFFSCAMCESVCKYCSCNATGLLDIISAAPFKALEAAWSPSAAMTLALASLNASASVAFLFSEFNFKVAYEIFSLINYNL